MFSVGDVVIPTGTTGPKMTIESIVPWGPNFYYYVKDQSSGTEYYISTTGYSLASSGSGIGTTAAGSGCLLSLFGIFG